MYEAHWELAAKPFENTREARFYYPSETHQGALLKLRYAIENRRGAALLSGETGSGKTLLVDRLAAGLPPHCSPIAQVVFPLLGTQELVAYIAEELSGERNDQPPGVGQSLRTIERCLAEAAQQQRQIVLAIDEAHLLASQGTLETLRLLLNLRPQEPAALMLLVIGQSGVLNAVARFPELDERFGVKCLLRPFGFDDTAGYVQHRLQAAGSSKPIFDAKAVEALHYLSHGSVRQINRLADLALLIGFAEQRSLIDASQIEAVAEELVAVAPD
jgi:type II secretory pathway predicted ATPase ExeA